MSERRTCPGAGLKPTKVVRAAKKRSNGRRVRHMARGLCSVCGRNVPVYPDVGTVGHHTIDYPDSSPRDVAILGGDPSL